MADKTARVRIRTSSSCIEGEMEGGTFGLDFTQLQPFVTLSNACMVHSETTLPLYRMDLITIQTSAIETIMVLPSNDPATKVMTIVGVDSAVAATTVDTLMTTNMLTVRIDDDVKEAFRLMMANRIRHLPVLDKNRMVGLVSERDLRTFLLGGENMALEEMLVPLVRLKTVQPDTPVTEALQIMLDNKISCLPILEKGTLAGLITETDLLKFLKDILMV